LDREASALDVPPVGRRVKVVGVDVSVTGFEKSARLDVISAVKWLGSSCRSELTRESRFLIAACEHAGTIEVALERGIPGMGSPGSSLLPAAARRTTSPALL
jgi:hypothetical protein